MRGIRDTITDPDLPPLGEGQRQHTKDKGVSKWTGERYGERRTTNRRTEPEVVLSLNLEDGKRLQRLITPELAKTSAEAAVVAYVDLQVALAERR